VCVNLVFKPFNAIHFKWKKYAMKVRSIFKRHTSFLQGYYCACCDVFGLMSVIRQMWTKIKWLLVRFHYKYFKLLPTASSSPPQRHAVFLRALIATQLIINISERLSSQHFHNRIYNTIQTLSWAWWIVLKFSYNFSEKHSNFVPQCPPPPGLLYQLIE
jgi:hypothetical protein